MRLAIDPLEGTNLCARGEPGAITVIAGALKGRGKLLGNIDGYLDKVVIGKDLAQKVLSMKATQGPYFYVKVDKEHGLIDNPVKDIIRWIAHVRQKPVSEVVVMVLERDRNHKLIEELRTLNAQVLLIKDGDTTAGLLALDSDRDVDIAMGIGAAPEGVITAAICRVFQGYMEARWWLEHPEKGAAQKAKLLEQKIDPCQTARYGRHGERRCDVRSNRRDLQSIHARRAVFVRRHGNHQHDLWSQPVGNDLRAPRHSPKSAPAAGL